MDLRKKYGKIAVIMGGSSSEREVSLLSGKMVLQSLLSFGLDAHAFDPKITSICKLVEDGFDRAFLLTHGPMGEDGTIQGALEYLKIPYTNSGVLASALSMDKYRTKLIWQQFNIPMAKSQYVVANNFNYSAFMLEVDLPVVVKPVSEGSTLGLSKVYTLEKLEDAIKLAFAYDSHVLIEELIVGDELAITVCDGIVYPIVKIEAPQDNYDYQNKYFTNDTKYITPYDLGMLQQVVEHYAVVAYNAVGAAGVARLDCMLHSKHGPFFLEINTIPGMTSHSLVPMAFKAAGVDYDRLCLMILDRARLHGARV